MPVTQEKERKGKLVCVFHIDRHHFHVLYMPISTLLHTQFTKFSLILLKLEALGFKSMESDHQVITSKDMKFVVASGLEQLHGAPNNNLGQQQQQQQQQGGLTRQPSMTKNNNCLCSPTTHAGSFRCRLHRAPNSLQRTKSMESESLPDEQPPASAVDGDANKDPMH